MELTVAPEGQQGRQEEPERWERWGQRGAHALRQWEATGSLQPAAPTLGNRGSQDAHVAPPGPTDSPALGSRRRGICTGPGICHRS